SSSSIPDYRLRLTSSCRIVGYTTLRLREGRVVSSGGEDRVTTWVPDPRSRCAHGPHENGPGPLADRQGIESVNGHWWQAATRTVRTFTYRPRATDHQQLRRVACPPRNDRLVERGGG